MMVSDLPAVIFGSKNEIPDVVTNTDIFGRHRTRLVVRIIETGSAKHKTCAKCRKKFLGIEWSRVQLNF